MSLLRIVTIASLLVCFAAATSTADEKPVRLFILSGQSNMAGLRPEISFIPTVMQAFEGDDVIVVKNAKGGQPIRRWYKEWKLPGDVKEQGPKYTNGDLYDQLLAAVTKALGDKRPDSVAFVWMQGERDARMHWEAEYYKALRGVVQQLREDLKVEEIAVVVGRLSDHKKGDASWDAVRTAQEKVADAEPLGAWVDTDDLNGKEGLHYTKEGYAELGKRFAESATKLIRQGDAQ